MMKRAVLTAAMLLAATGVAQANKTVAGDSGASASTPPAFPSLQDLDVQPLSREEMRQTAGRFVLDGSINLAPLVERLSPTQQGQLTQLLVAAQQRGIPLPSALSALIPAGTGTAAQGTEAQGIETH